MMAAYSFTSKPIGDSLCQAASRGVAVSMVLDQKSNPENDIQSKRNNAEACGVAVSINGHYPIVHDTFIIADI